MKHRLPHFRSYFSLRFQFFNREVHPLPESNKMLLRGERLLMVESHLQVARLWRFGLAPLVGRQTKESVFDDPRVEKAILEGDS